MTSSQRPGWKIPITVSCQRESGPSDREEASARSLPEAPRTLLLSSCRPMVHGVEPHQTLCRQCSKILGQRLPRSIPAPATSELSGQAAA